jgi:hypothetical protein
VKELCLALRNDLVERASKCRFYQDVLMDNWFNIVLNRLDPDCPAWVAGENATHGGNWLDAAAFAYQKGLDVLKEYS